ncbi:YjbH domain-containing protein [Spectribacter hydrogenoxidans]|uniref:YjbH domain-containing protein n=1 Tax=Spectribacter hydrogenoxidans TaxID=3075608 RepID=A0ABU3BXF2_9GAMM|nr:YjbH domain-containing protein [Salinisphaera sp. W335]MDT0633940.1 YjbH domain-containing protein [Salinisphaera sp. W335]
MAVIRQQRVLVGSLVLISASFCACAGKAALAEDADVDTGEHAVFQTDFGGVGLLQKPTARMAPLARFSGQYLRVDPYENYTLSFQPFEWAEVGLRYTEIRNRRYRASDDPDRNLLDKGFDAKFRLLEESRFRPSVALGFRDVGGTGLFSGEYLVASKRFHDFDFSLGVGWGYFSLGSDITNPLGTVMDRFDSRANRGRSDGGLGGEFNFGSLFVGPIGLFGGVQYRTPIDGLYAQLEYDGNDYQNEPQNNAFERDSPFNVGLRYRLTDWISLTAAWERGNQARLGATITVNLAEIGQPKADPPEPRVNPAPERTTREWSKVSRALAANAGVRVSRILREVDTLTVEGEPIKYRALAESELRASRILHNVTADEFSEFRFRWKSVGLQLREDVLPREPLPKLPFLGATTDTNEFHDQDFRQQVYAQDVPRSEEQRPTAETLYEQDPQSFYYAVTPGYKQLFGGPDGYLQQLIGRLTLDYRTDENGWLSAVIAANLWSTFEGADFLGPSQLPRARTFIKRYYQDVDVGLYNLQYSRTRRLADDWYALAYAGILELMYTGVGGELMYRPFDSWFALGFDANYVRQREFDQRFGLRDYATVTGHATAYMETGIKDVLAKVSVGRYLARDVGVTFDFSRRFDSGIRFGAFATFTSAGDKFGEGSFDKGLYLNIPMDFFYNTSSREKVSLLYRPLTRDGGAKLNRRYQLYDLTSDRDTDGYWRGFERSADE